MTVHMHKSSGEPRPGASALCGADHRHGVTTTYSIYSVTCDDCKKLYGNLRNEQSVPADLKCECGGEWTEYLRPDDAPSCPDCGSAVVVRV